jgi:hypothetical protein
LVDGGLRGSAEDRGHDGPPAGESLHDERPAPGKGVEYVTGTLGTSASGREDRHPAATRDQVGGARALLDEVGQRSATGDERRRVGVEVDDESGPDRGGRTEWGHHGKDPVVTDREAEDGHGSLRWMARPYAATPAA